jgi:PKD repeat protein
MKIISFYATTVDALAQANGPYTVDAGTLIQFVGGPAVGSTDFSWDFGDGATANTRIATHAYADDGIYVAKLTTKVNQPGGVSTRQFAKVIVRNVPATIDSIPDQTVLEGQEVEYSATFHTPEWPDKHTARFDFGDDSLPVQATVAETNQAPQASGTATAKHAYCKAGDYIVTVTVQDEDGGIGSQSFTVHASNVPPKVVATDLFAYACTPITLRACFYDPGWCETHTAVWDFGDCTPVSPAEVVETHTPPEGVGSATASHVYHDCGEFHATCVVTDSAGGSGTESIVVRVVDVRNKHFENGFRQLTVGQVANSWEPYPAQSSQSTGELSSSSGAQIFGAEENIFRRGEHSQRIAIPAKSVSGIYQRVGANPGWDYQATAWFQLDQRKGGRCRLGLDPVGGTDPTAASIVWSESRKDTEWTELLVVATATAAQVTIFLEVSTQPPPAQPPFQVPDQGEIAADSNGAVGYFDDVALLPYLWKLKDCFRVIKKPSPQCVDWKDEKKPREVPSPYQDGGFSFSCRTGQSLLIVTFGPPPGQGKLMIPSRGLEVALPKPAMEVTAIVFSASQTPVELTAFSVDGSTVGTAKSQPGSTAQQSLTINGHGMVKLLLGTGVMEGTLIQLCVTENVSPATYQGTVLSG